MTAALAVLVNAFAFAFWRVWLGRHHLFGGPTPGSRLTKWSVFALLMAPGYFFADPILVSLVILWAVLWMSVRHDNFGTEKYATVRYFPIGWFINWLRHNKERLPGFTPFGLPVAPKGCWTCYGEILVGAFVGLVYTVLVYGVEIDLQKLIGL